MATRQAALGQYFTPAWVPELLLTRYYPNLTERDAVYDPACGDARFVRAVPRHVPAFGIEIDPEVAAQARANTDRPILNVDFMLATLPVKPTLFIGNPPFKARTIDGFLARCFELLEYGGEVGFILPAYYLQTASTVARLSLRWSMAQDMLPRNLFQDLTKPINFVRFTKAPVPVMTGFYLYLEVDALDSLREEFREMFCGNRSRPNVWLETVYAALKICGGKATLSQLYACIENRRPTANKWWRQKVRQVAGENFERLEPGVFELPAGYQLQRRCA